MNVLALRYTVCAASAASSNTFTSAFWKLWNFEGNAILEAVDFCGFCPYNKKTKYQMGAIGMAKKQIPIHFCVPMAFEFIETQQFELY